MKKLIPLLIIITLAFGAVSATSFVAPTASAPFGNITPIHTGGSQTKNGNLSVNTFIARGVTNFRQQIYINNTNLGESNEGEKGNLKGSSGATSENANLVLFGGVIENNPADDNDDVTYNTSIIGTDIITAQNFLQSGNVSHDAAIAQKRDLCADGDGNVLFCKLAVAEIDVCENIQGTQTNPPTGMVRSGNDCVWATITPPTPTYAVTHVPFASSVTVGGGYDDHIQCNIELNISNTSGSSMSFKINYVYNGNPDRFGDCVVEVPNGQRNGVSEPKPMDNYRVGDTVTRSCIDMNVAPPAGVTVLPQSQC